MGILARFLFPLVMMLAFSWLARRMLRQRFRSRNAHQSPSSKNSARVVEGRYRVVDDDPQEPGDQP